MFERKTVFILGAGASWHYGYPTGEGLVKAVVSKTDKVKDFLKCDMDENLIHDFMRLDYLEDKYSNIDLLLGKIPQFELKNFEELSQKLKEINPPVIDYFLKEHPSLRTIGQMMIAWVIMECEKNYYRGVNRYKSNNYNRNRKSLNSNDSDLSNFNDDWFRFLVHKLTSGCKEPQDLLENDVHFITFNYDVSLDHALYRRLNSIEYFQSGQVAQDFFQKENLFLHMYGRIRENPFVDFMQMLPDEVVQPRSKIGHIKDILNATYLGCNPDWGIRTIDSDNKDNDQNTHNRAKELIAEAEDVYILGYGFDENNSSRLGLNESLRFSRKNSNSTKRVHFTNYSDKQVINKRASKIFFGDQHRFHPKDGFVITMPPLASDANTTHTYEKSISDVYGAIQNDFDFL